MSKPLSYKTFIKLKKVIGGNTSDEQISIREIGKGADKLTYKNLKQLLQGKRKLVLITIANPEGSSGYR